MSDASGHAGMAVALVLVASTVGAAVGTCTLAVIKAMDAYDARQMRKKRAKRTEWDRKRQRQRGF